VLVARDVDAMTDREIAARLGTRREAVRSARSRIRKRVEAFAAADAAELAAVERGDAIPAAARRVRA
jgi:DNA-directed RNA polymerase specialized sigma24 family protein